jgi:murein DD-endopeptidase MepM/ murein hydrolase activator NlpD
MVAAQDGVVAFAGWVAGALFISIDHQDGVRTSYSWLSAIQVKRGAVVSRGSLIGATGQGHPGVTPPHLHFGARVGADYLDPILLLEGANVVDLIHLAPLPEPAPPGRALSLESFSRNARLTARGALLEGSPTGLVASRTPGHLGSFRRERGPPFTPLLQ